MTLSHVMGLRYNKIIFFPPQHFEFAYGAVRRGKRLSDRFSIENGLEEGDVFSHCFQLNLEYVIKWVQEKPEKLQN